ncbi:hypothetical protein V493_03888 [Pseudogymnoascus sp. VKM F-4281 (FW-2241)]|nr:hypothetical protein V493_03888 [Pseudogymnoascus sp. VKM F-4281 (FW-2241)]
MADSSHPQEPPSPEKHQSKYGGFTRFEIELEFVQCLSSNASQTHTTSSTSPPSPPPAPPLPAPKTRTPAPAAQAPSSPTPPS